MLRVYDAIIVDCSGQLEDTDTLAGVLALATFAVIPMIPERAAVQPTLRTARLGVGERGGAGVLPDGAVGRQTGYGVMPSSGVRPKLRADTSEANLGRRHRRT